MWDIPCVAGPTGAVALVGRSIAKMAGGIRLMIMIIKIIIIIIPANLFGWTGRTQAAVATEFGHWMEARRRSPKRRAMRCTMCGGAAVRQATCKNNKTPNN